MAGTAEEWILGKYLAQQRGGEAGDVVAAAVAVAVVVAGPGFGADLAETLLERLCLPAPACFLKDAQKL